MKPRHSSDLYKLSVFFLYSAVIIHRVGLYYFFAEVEFVHAVTAGGSVKFVASGVNFSVFTHFLLKLLKLGEIDSVKA